MHAFCIHNVWYQPTIIVAVRRCSPALALHDTAELLKVLERLILTSPLSSKQEKMIMSLESLLGLETVAPHHASSVSVPRSALHVPLFKVSKQAQKINVILPCSTILAWRRIEKLETETACMEMETVYCHFVVRCLSSHLQNIIDPDGDY